MSESSQPNDGNAVLITLTTMNPITNAEVRQRQLRLSEQAPSVKIGRASKVQSKGFVAAPDNAWFDSPVMSRFHAMISADFSRDSLSPRIYVEDIGSTHGTFHRAAESGREIRLQKEEPEDLEDGDTLRFGIDIYRSTTAFPPHCVDVGIEHSKSHATGNTISTKNRFSVPDESDEESQLPRIPKRSSHIDLTGNDVMSSTFIDLTSEPEPTPAVSYPALSSPALTGASALVTQDIGTNEGEADGLSDLDSMVDSDDDLINPSDAPSSPCSSASDDNDEDDDDDSVRSDESHLYSDSDSLHMMNSDEESSENEIDNEDNSDNDEEDDRSEDSNYHANNSLSNDDDLFAMVNDMTALHKSIHRAESPKPVQKAVDSLSSLLSSVQNSSADVASQPQHTIKSTAEILGDKFGKRNYFAAREQNRMHFAAAQRRRSPPPESALRETLASGFCEKDRPSQGCEQASTKNAPTPTKPAVPSLSKPQPSVQPNIELEPTAAPTGSAWTASGNDFINNPCSLPFSSSAWQTYQSVPYLTEPRPGQDLDDSSAFNYQQSKLKARQMGPEVRRLTIGDLLTSEPAKESEPEPQAQTPAQAQDIVQEARQTQKRLADALVESLRLNSKSVQNPSEDRVTALTENPWAANKEPDEESVKNSTPGKRKFTQAFDGEDVENGEPSRTQPASDAQAQASETEEIQKPEEVASDDLVALDHAQQNSNSSTAQLEMSGVVRPSKRRRLAHAAACVALGGAGVLSALIMSAPTFG